MAEIKEWIKNNAMYISVFKVFVLGIFCYLSAIFLVYIFLGKVCGFETIKTETDNKLLEVIDTKNETIIVNGVVVHSYYMVVEYGNADYEIKIEKEIFENIQIGDYVECKIIFGEKANCLQSIRIYLNKRKNEFNL